MLVLARQLTVFAGGLAEGFTSCGCETFVRGITRGHDSAMVRVTVTGTHSSTFHLVASSAVPYEWADWAWFLLSFHVGVELLVWNSLVLALFSS